MSILSSDYKDEVGLICTIRAGQDHAAFRHCKQKRTERYMLPSGSQKYLLRRSLTSMPPGYLDQAWVDLFFRYISSEPRGASVIWDEGPSFSQNVRQDWMERTVKDPDRRMRSVDWFPR